MRPFPALLLAGLALAALLAAAPVLAQDAEKSMETIDREAPDAARRLDADLLRLRERLGEPSGLLFRYERSLRLLGETMEQGEYRHFYGWLQEEIVQPWHRIQAQQILQLAEVPPMQLSPHQRELLQSQGLALRRLETQLRHARRLLTRLGRQDEERHRRHEELQQLTRRFQRQLQALEALEPERAAVHQEWFDGIYLPRLERLQAREQVLGEATERLLRWTEDPALREMLGQLRRVGRAMEMLRRRFHF